MTNHRDRKAAHPYQLFILVLCLYALLALAAEVVFPLSEDTRRLLLYADTVICIAFLIDFVVSLVKAPKKWEYLYTWGWIDFASSIPGIQALRWGRVARAIRVLRVLRGVRATKVIGTFILDRRAESAFLAATLLTALFLTSSSIAILHFEAGPDANIRTPQDALWWAFVTITTVGYGDRYPVTTEGRLVAVVLMVVGVGLFGTVAGLVAAWFRAPGEKRQTDDLDGIKEDIRELRRLVGSWRQDDRS